MFRSAASKVMWVGRATVFLVGLAVILALVFGVASTAMGANGGNFILGKKNVASAVSTLVKQGPGPALNLMVKAGQPPMKVNSSGKVANLNADKLDGKDSTGFYAAGSKVADSAHADQADNATNAGNADTVDGKHAADFYAAGSKVADADTLDGLDSVQLKPLTASVSAFGFDLRGSGATSVSKLGLGTYEVQFDRTVNGCNRVAGIGKALTSTTNPSFVSAIPGGEVTTFNTLSGGNRIGVITRDSAGNLADRDFHIAVFC